MKKILNTITRRSGKITDFFLLAGFLSVLLIYGGSILSLVLEKVLGFERLTGMLFPDPDTAEFFTLYLEFFGIWIIFFIIISVFRNNRPMWKCLGFRRGGNSILAILAGMLLGFGTNGFCIVMSWLLGDIKLSFNCFDPLMFCLFFLAVTIQSGAEEIADRCYLYQKLRRRYRHPAVAIVLNSLIFMALHLANPGLTVLAVAQLVLIGLVFSLIVYYYDCLWTVIMYHASWNFSQSIFFGLPNSGIVSKFSVFKLEAASARNGLFYNVNFGVEGSAGAVALIAVVMVVILVINRGKGERMDLWKDMEEAAERAEIPNNLPDNSADHS